MSSTALEQAVALLASDEVDDWRRAMIVLRTELSTNPSWDRGKLLLGQAQAKCGDNDGAAVTFLDISRGGANAGIREAAAANLGVCLGKFIPRHQLAWINDTERTRAWSSALSALATPAADATASGSGPMVVFVGGSTGPAGAVHAMLAAHKGAGEFHVAAGSALGATAAAAAVTANGLGERVKVAAAGGCGPGPFDAIAWDFGGSVDRPALRQFVAARATCTASAAVLPAEIVIRASLVQSETLCLLNGLPNGLVTVTEEDAKAVGGSLGSLNGVFDLRDFAAGYTRPQRPCQLQSLVIRRGEEPAWRFASDVQELFRIAPSALCTEADCAALGHGEWVELTAACDAAEVALVYWADIRLGPGEELSNAPQQQGAPGSFADLWAVQRAVFCPLGASAWSCKTGAKVRLRAHLADSSTEPFAFEVDFGSGPIRSGFPSPKPAAAAAADDCDDCEEPPPPPPDPSAIPDYHFSMLNDIPRNAAYMLGIAAAVQRAAERGGGEPPAVMDIGAGSGLLSIMAQRAGAGTVVAVERDEALAGVASAVVDRNGAGEEVCVVAASSRDIEVPPEGRFDVIVSEILGSDPLSEGALPTLRHASEQLLAPDGEFVPARIVLRAALAQAGPAVAATLWAHGPGGGLDCAALSPLEPPRVSVHGPHAERLGFRVLTSSGSFPVDLSGRPPALSGVVPGVVRGEADGEADCVLYWFEIDFGDGVSMSVGPDAGYRSHWSQTVHPLLPVGTRKRVKAGEAIKMEARFSIERLVFTLMSR